MANKALRINIVASLVAFIVNMGINFVLSPYIIENIGVDAYGFVSLANNFINYASLLTIALNSMAGRFITISLHKSDKESANKYFTSVFIANLIISIVLLLVSILSVIYIEEIVNVPVNILKDVRLLFLLLFINFIISIIGSTFSVATFARNKLYLGSLRGIESNIIRAILILVLFIMFKPKVFYLGVVSCIVTLYTVGFNIFYTKKLLPEIKIKLKYYDLKYVIEIISSGIWNTVTKLGQILLDGVDLLITNLFLGPIEMGVLAVSKTIPNLIVSIVGTIAGIFSPDFTINYAKGDQEALLSSIKQSIRIMSVFVNIPVSILIVFGNSFYLLWTPNEDARLLQVLSILACLTIVVSGGINCIYNVFTVTNKLKLNSMVVLGTGVLNMLIVFILLKTTNLGIFAVAGVSTILSILRNIVFTAPYGAKCLNLKWNIFYPEIFKGILGTIVICCFGYILRKIIVVDSWLSLIYSTAICGTAGLILNGMVVLSKEEIVYLKRKFIKRGN
ncbi:Polysaccharide biosynthesis protein [uncultured Clostridium sp.]|nr:MATE family efflux transporter [Clostridium saudiense]SCJ99644.1 Polysaccharide biosynthesis protein [uncultured Clostridium sp.]